MPRSFEFVSENTNQQKREAIPERKILAVFQVIFLILFRLSLYSLFGGLEWSENENDKEKKKDRGNTGPELVANKKKQARWPA